MGRGDSAVPAASDEFLRDWQQVRGDDSIQYAALPEPEAPETPAWLERLAEWLGEVFAPVANLIGLSLPVLGWIALAAVLALAVWLAWRHLAPLAARPGEAEAPAGWTPERGAALDLLGEADRLAAEGRYAQATHLLLQRSIGQIAEARPDLLRPSSTAREIAALAALPEIAREAFATIAARVERSLFALRELDAGDWQAAREAYSRFALGPAARVA